jgi:CspA family cold shock protein
MPQGTVKWFNQEKGYGFISPDDHGEDLFVHHTGIAGSGFKSLEEGESVSYEVTQGRKRMQAVNVSKGSTDTPGSRDTEDLLRVPLEVEGTARILSEHFTPMIFTGRWWRRYAGGNNRSVIPPSVWMCVAQFCRQVV